MYVYDIVYVIVFVQYVYDFGAEWHMIVYSASHMAVKGSIDTHTVKTLLNGFHFHEIRLDEFQFY